MSIIYALLDPRDRQVRYVGMTTEKAERRRRRHINVSKRRETHCARWVRGLIKAGFEPEIIILEEVPSVDDLAQREIFWIGLYRKHGANLTNLTDGGEGTRAPRSDETRRKISAALRGRKALPRSAETCKKLSDALKGRSNPAAVKRAADVRRGMKLPQEWREKMAAAQKGRRHTDETRARMSLSQKARFANGN